MASQRGSKQHWANQRNFMVLLLSFSCGMGQQDATAATESAISSSEPSNVMAYYEATHRSFRRIEEALAGRGAYIWGSRAANPLLCAQGSAWLGTKSLVCSECLTSVCMEYTTAYSDRGRQPVHTQTAPPPSTM